MIDSNQPNKQELKIIIKAKGTNEKPHNRLRSEANNNKATEKSIPHHSK